MTSQLYRMIRIRDRKRGINMTEEMKLHHQLFICVDKNIHPSTQYFQEFKVGARIYLEAGVVDGCKSCLDICEKLQTAGKITIGKYDNLKTILKTADLMSTLFKIEEIEKQILQALHIKNTVATTTTPAGAGPQKSTTVGECVKTERKTGRGKWHKIFQIIKDSSEVCSSWKVLGKALGFNETDLQTIIKDNPSKPQGQCYVMLYKWRQRNEPHAVPNVLIKALRRVTFSEVADKITEYVLNLPLDD